MASKKTCLGFETSYHPSFFGRGEKGVLYI